jgi:hypothetical protein
VRLTDQPIEAESKPVQELKCSDVEALWVIKKSQVAIPEGFCVEFDSGIGNTIHNFEPSGEIQFVKAHAVAELVR